MTYSTYAFAKQAQSKEITYNIFLPESLVIEPISCDHAILDNGYELYFEHVQGSERNNCIQKINGKWEIHKSLLNRMKHTASKELYLHEHETHFEVNYDPTGQAILGNIPDLGYEQYVPVNPRRGNSIIPKYGVLNSLPKMRNIKSKELASVLTEIWFKSYGFDIEKIKKNMHGFYTHVHTVCPLRLSKTDLNRIVSVVAGKRIRIEESIFCLLNCGLISEIDEDGYLVYIDKEELVEPITQDLSDFMSFSGGRLYRNNIATPIRHLREDAIILGDFYFNANDLRVKHGQYRFNKIWR